ncbi:MAG: C25 family cysteine peptidase, partial [SAR202 cluster bacterium]|nr:C25 family cysteine peptidase [SAR202 cluster bacterium]
MTSTEHFEPQNNDPTTAPIADPNTLYVTHISNSTDVDFYRIAVPPDPGTRVSVFLSHLTVDEDLVMYRPQTALLSSADPSRETLGSAPIEDTGIDLNNDSGQLAPETLQDIRSESLPLVSLSTNRDTSDETVETLSRGESGFYTIQVSGYNGAFSDDPYVLRVKVSAPPPPPSCKPRRFEFDGQGVPGSLPSIGSDVNTLFLVNQEQLGNLYGPAEAGLVMAALNDLASRSAIGVTGAVIPVEGDLSVRSAYQAWNTNPCSPDEANDIVSAIIALVNDLRIDSGTGDALLPDLKYVVMVGSDEAIPMARVPDLTRLSNQRDYAQDLEFAGNGALFGSYITENILTDDPYGDFDPIPWLDRQLFVPDVAMGRMVETPQEIIDAVDQYIRFNGALDPQTAVTSGYDFLTDGAEQVDEILAEQLGAANTNTLINETWTASDLIDLIGPSAGSTAPDIASVNAHFDHYRALPADQNAAGTQNELFNTQHVSAFPTGSLEGNILFSMGCQAGLSVSDVLIGSPTSQQAERLLDWPQAYAQQGALYAANTGFGYGDTEVVALSERLMALFSQNLNGSMTVGQALTFAKQNYYASLGVYGVYDEKVLVEATFYGLPMYTVGSTVNPPPPPEPLPLEIDPITGLQSSTIHTEPNFELVDGVNGDFYQIEGQTQVTHYRPIQPRDEFEVTQPTAVAHGAIITSLTSVDELGFDVAFARPIIDQTDNEPVPEFGSVAFPTVFQNVNTYNDVNGEQQRLVILPGQFFRDDNGMGVQRRFLSLDARVYYSDDDDDFVAPTLHRIGAEVIGSNAKIVVNATDDSPTTVVRVLVLFRDESGLWRYRSGSPRGSLPQGPQQIRT